MSERPVTALALHAPDAGARIEPIAQALRQHGVAIERLRPVRKSARRAEEQRAAQLDDADAVLVFAARSPEADTDDLELLLRDLPIDLGELEQLASGRTMLVLLDELRIPESLSALPAFSLAGMDEASQQSAAGMLADAIRELAARRQSEPAADASSSAGETATTAGATPGAAPDEPQQAAKGAPGEAPGEPGEPERSDKAEAAEPSGGERPEPAKEERGSRRFGAAGVVLAFITLMFGLYLHRDVPVAGEDGFYADADGARYALIVPQPFSMGSDGSPGRLDERPARTVSLQAPFLIAVQEVTNAQYRAYLEATDARAGLPRSFIEDVRDGWPVVNVSFEDAQGYASWQSARQDVTFRLPSEAEWEYVAGQVSAALDDLCAFVNFRGGEPSASMSPSSNLLAPASADDPYCSYESPTLVEVNELAADSLGLHHVYGNAAEWVADCYASDYLDAPADGSANVSGDCEYRVFRGGSWLTPAAWLGPSLRARAPPDYRDFHLGFRLVRDLDPLDAWAIARPDRDWNSLFPIAAWLCYGLAGVMLLPWLLEIPRGSPGTRSAKRTDSATPSDTEEPPGADGGGPDEPGPSTGAGSPSQ